MASSLQRGYSGRTVETRSLNPDMGVDVLAILKVTIKYVCRPHLLLKNKSSMAQQCKEVLGQCWNVLPSKLVGGDAWLVLLLY